MGLMWRALVWFSIRNRHRKATAIKAFMDARDCRTVLLVGASGGARIQGYEDIVENTIIEGRTVLAGFNVFPVDGTPYPFRVADARDQPFDDDYADFSLANAVIEHVGDRHDQERMVAEMSRTAKAWAITTPNRWFPVESHTGALFRHWSPGWRARQPKFTRILSRSEFRQLVGPDAVILGHWWSPTFTALWVKPGALRDRSLKAEASSGEDRVRPS